MTAGAQTQVYAGQLFNQLQIQAQEATIEKSTQEQKETAEEEAETVNKQKQNWYKGFVQNGAPAYYFRLCSDDSLTKRAAQRVLTVPETDKKYLLLLKLTFYAFYQSQRH